MKNTASNLKISFTDALTFAEWVDINCIRDGKHSWTHRNNNFLSSHTTEKLYEIYKLEKWMD